MTGVLAIGVGALFAVGTYLLLQRSLTRIAIGLSLLGHGTNLLLLLVGGAAGEAPIVGHREPFADPTPQALALTAIVIAFGTTAFLLAMAWRSWREGDGDDVEHASEGRGLGALPGRPEPRAEDEVR